MSKRTALIIDDEADIRELLEITLSRMNIGTETAANVSEAKSLIDGQTFDLCLTDMRLPDGTGKDVIRHLQATSPQTPIAVITAYGNIEDAVESLKAGAFDFVSKPIDLKGLRELVNTALRVSNEPSATPSEDTLIGSSNAIQEIKEKITKLARSQAPVYLSGESGTGKELVANLIHAKGPRSHFPFIPVNCGAIPVELVESEFFGHGKGSFTGAHADKSGLFEAAHQGTLFLDEVGDLPLPMQVKLLRAIQERKIRPIGSAAEKPIDVRIICATHRNLADLVDEGQFRQDLYYRLNVVQLTLPPLRERKSDIPALVQFLLQGLCERMALAALPSLTPEAETALRNYSFPGNIRELENILERALTLMSGEHISEADLMLQTEGSIQPTHLDSITNLNEKVEELERAAIIGALNKTSNNKTKAAELLGVSFRSFRYRLKKLGIK